jgi:hypothetical protein
MDPIYHEIYPLDPIYKVYGSAAPSRQMHIGTSEGGSVVGCTTVPLWVALPCRCESGLQYSAVVKV